MKIALRRYLLSPSRLRQVDPNRETFETFLTQEVEPLFALREAAVVRFRQARWLAKQEKGALPLTWQEVAETFTRTGPRAGLATTLARELPMVLTQVFDRLRKVLRREREPQAVGRVEQLDATCLRWLTRQPGYTVAQKAGPRQRVLAVVRRENYDILENRVLQDLLLRTERLVEQWLEKYEKSFPNHETVKAVKRLGNLCQKGLELEALQNVSPLHDVPKPNYVLTQDALYRRIWDAYLLVVEYYRLIEGLWDRREELTLTLKQWQADSKKYGDSFYRSELWICPIKNGKPWAEDYPRFTVHEKGGSPYWKYKEEGHVTIDLLGLHLSDVLLMPDGNLHPNAKPRLIDFNAPYVDFCLTDELKNRHRGRYLLDILHERDHASLAAYFEQLYGAIGGSDWTILVADNWEPDWLEAIKQAASAAIGASNVFLLWRTVAYELGTETPSSAISVPRLNGPCDKVWLSFDNDGRPCHHAYRFHKEEFDIPFLPNRPKRTFFEWLWEPGKQDNAVALQLQRGVDKFKSVSKDLYKTAPAYWDELMGLYMVYQTPDERIELRTLVEYNEHFAGGATYIGTAKQEFHLKGASGIRLYLLEWPRPARDKNLSLFACKLKEIAGTEQIWMLAKATPGQGVVKLELNHPSLPHPETIALAGLTKTNETATKLEGEMKRSFPPVSPKVIADGNLLSDREKELIYDFAQGKAVSLDGGLFYHAHYLYPLGTLPPNMSKLEYLRRGNVFGAEEGHQYPDLDSYSLFGRVEMDFDALFRRLNDYAKREIRQEVYSHAVRLIAWTYQSDNSLFSDLRSACVRLVTQERKSHRELITFCANLCNKPSEWSALFESCMEFFENEWSGCAERQRLLYNLIMFNEDFISALHLHLPQKKEDVKTLVRVLCDTSIDPLIGDVQRNSCLRSLLYLLRIRLFDKKHFAMPGIDVLNYNRIATICQEGKIWPGDGTLTKSYREVLRHYLNGNGRIDEIPQQN